MKNQLISSQNKQYEFWEEESSRDGYCLEFIKDIENNHWIDMLFKIEKSKKIEVTGKVLELGGGSQYLSRYIAKNRNSSVICTDISPQRISDFNNYYNESLPNLKTEGCINAAKLPYEDESFDYIIGEAVLHHIEDIRSALYEINRCLKKGGTAIFLREPNVGAGVYFKRVIKNFLGHFTDKYHKKRIIANQGDRYEYNKNYLQWLDEFYTANFDVEVFPGWYFYNKKIIILKSRLPFIFSCSVCFYLKKI